MKCLRVFIRRLHNFFIERRICDGNLPRNHIRHEARRHVRPVLVDDRNIQTDRAALAVVRAQARQGRSEQEIRDLVLAVEPCDLCEDRERRIVNDDVGRLVFLVFIIAAGIERPHEVLPVESEPFRDIVRDSVVHDVRRVAVVRCFRVVELVEKLIVFFVPFFVTGIVALSCRIPLCEPISSLRNVKACDADIEIHGLQPGQLFEDDIHVPTAELCQPVVGQNVRPALFFG